MAEAVVEFDYDAEQEDELTLRAGDIIKHVVTAEGGWWEGELNGKKGMFPENFVKLKPKESGTKKDEKREATQRKSVRELANKFKDGVPLPGAQGSVKKKEPVKNKKCKVMFDYKAENEDELDLSVGQTIDFIKEVEEGWWEGMAGGKSGVFPSNFVEMIEDTEGEPPATSAGSGEKDPDFQEIKGKKVMGVGLGNIFQGGPIKLRNTGKKPDAGKPPKPDEKEPKLPATGPPDITKREKQGTVERAVVRYSYAAEQPDEISLKEGEVIRILDKHLEDEGWWRGEVHGKVGVFPDNFVELIPVQEEPAKAPKKPPPPVGKNMYPKLPDKAPSIEEKTISAKKDPEVPEKAAGVAALKKPMAPPPVGKKPGVTHKVEAPLKPDPPKPSESARVELRNKDLSNNHHAPSDSNKAEDGEEDNFDALESSSQKLTHLTALRAKGPKKRPPSTVLLPTRRRREDARKDIDKAADADEVTRERNHVQPEKPPPPVTKEQKHISPVEAEHGYRHHPPPHDPHINAPRGHHEVRNTHTSAPPPRPPEPSRPSEASADNPALARLVEELQREVRDMRTQTVSKNDYNDLRSDYLRLKQDFEVFRANHSKKLRELMMEVDDEKKLRLNTQVEMERVKKLLAETHV